MQIDVNESNDWTLVELARNGDEVALQVLSDRYKPLILSVHARFSNQQYELTEWVHEAMIILWSVVRKFDTARTRAFGSYYKNALINRRRDYTRRQNAKKRRGLYPDTSIDAQPTYFADFLTNDVSSSIDQLVAIRQQLIELIKHDLSKLERAVVMAIISGMTDSQIKQRLSLTTTQMHNATERIKRKVRQELGE